MIRQAYISQKLKDIEVKGVAVTKSFQSQPPKMKSKILFGTKLIIISYIGYVVMYETSTHGER